MNPFPQELFRIGPLSVTDTTVTTAVLSLLLLVALVILIRSERSLRTLETVYEALENFIVGISRADTRPLVPLVLTLWLFIGVANLAGLVPGVSSPTRDLSLTAALAIISFVSGHVLAIARNGTAYLRQYVSPHPLLLPLNLLGEISRTLALAFRLFGNMLSGWLVGAIVLYLAGFLVPVPLMLLSALIAVVQAYIFGVLTLVFAVGSLEAALQSDKKESS